MDKLQDLLIQQLWCKWWRCGSQPNFASSLDTHI